jgi:hypothetical protein
MQLEVGLTQEEMLDLSMAVPFTGVIPKPPATSLEEQEAKMLRLENKYSRIQISTVAQQLSNEMVYKYATINSLKNYCSS